MSTDQDWDALSAKFRQEFKDKMGQWTFTPVSQEEGVEVYRSTTAQSGVTCWKCVATVEVPDSESAVRTVFDAYYTWEHRKLWDTTFHADSGELCKLGNERRTLDYSRTLPVLAGVISARDFVDLREWSYAPAPDGESEDRDVIVAWGASVTRSDKPPVSGLVRGHNHPCGTMISRAGSEGGRAQVKVILVWHSDIKGWVPARAVDQAMGQQLITTIRGLRAYLNPPTSQ